MAGANQRWIRIVNAEVFDQRNQAVDVHHLTVVLACKIAHLPSQGCMIADMQRWTSADEKLVRGHSTALVAASARTAAHAEAATLMARWQGA